MLFPLPSRRTAGAAVIAAATVCSASAAAPLPSSASLGSMRLRGGLEVAMTRSASQQDISNPNVKRPGPVSKDPKKEKIWSLSQQYKPADKTSIQKCALSQLDVATLNASHQRVSGTGAADAVPRGKYCDVLP